MKNVSIDVDESIFQEFDSFIKENNFNMNTIMEIVMIKTIEDHGLDWLVSTLRNEIATKNKKKRQSIKLFKEKGFALTKYNTNFSSRNKGNNQYWINPSKDNLFSDWYIILNDDIKKQIYLLLIPQNSISYLKDKNDKQFNISLTYEELIDIHTEINFGKFLIDTINYDSLVF